MIKIYDTILTEQEKNQLEKFTLADGLIWERSYATVVKEDIPNWATSDKYQDIDFFFCNFYRDGLKFNEQYNDVVLFLLTKLNNFSNTKYEAVRRARINFVWKHLSNKPTYPHRDMLIKHNVLIYYFNDSDGNTILYDDVGNVIQEVEPKKGRFLLFDGNYYHSGGVPNNYDKRIVMNINLMD